MALFTTEGLLDANQYLLGITTSYSWRVQLFVNALVVSVGTVAGDFVECALGGYARVPIAPMSWTTVSAGGVFSGTYPLITFNFNAYAGGVTIYGWYAINPATGRSAVCETFLTPYGVPASGGSMTLAPEYFDQNF